MIASEYHDVQVLYQVRRIESAAGARATVVIELLLRLAIGPDRDVLRGSRRPGAVLYIGDTKISIFATHPGDLGPPTPMKYRDLALAARYF